MPNYGDPKYWEQRYEDQLGTTFDWLEDYETLKPILEEAKAEKTSRILNLGCGNSEFCERMYDDGYHYTYNIDICENVIKFMTERNMHREKMIFDVMDVRDLQYEDNTFDLVIDKSTMDALLCGDQSFLNVAIMTKEVQRVLKTGGIYMVISYGTPENRINHIERDHLSFDISIYTIKKESDDGSDKEKVHYVYICKKKEDADQKAENFSKVYYELEKQEMEDYYGEEDEYNENIENNENVEINENPQYQEYVQDK